MLELFVLANQALLYSYYSIECKSNVLLKKNGYFLQKYISTDIC